MIIYRIHQEGNEARGPFVGGGVFIYRDYCEDNSDPYLNPAPAVDNIPYRDRSFRSYVFGFVSLEQLKEWFPCEKGRKAMYEWSSEQIVSKEWFEPFVVGVFSVDLTYVEIGGHQVIFNLEMAERIGTINLETLECRSDNCDLG